jgi:hypothetical protein
VTAPDIIRAVLPVTRTLDELGIPYYVGGSVASSVYGSARATMDVDLVADIEPEHVPVLVQAFRSKYYVDELMIAEAVERRASFNLIHLQTSIKIDVFVQPEGEYHQAAMSRRREDTLDDEDAAPLFVASAEDVILSKLQWYELGGRVSERQWLDVTGVIKVQARSLDTVYLGQWARDLGVSSLLLKAFGDSGVPFP